MSTRMNRFWTVGEDCSLWMTAPLKYRLLELVGKELGRFEMVYIDENWSRYISICNLAMNLKFGIANNFVEPWLPSRLLLVNYLVAELNRAILWWRSRICSVAYWYIESFTIDSRLEQPFKSHRCTHSLAVDPPQETNYRSKQHRLLRSRVQIEEVGREWGEGKRKGS